MAIVKGDSFKDAFEGPFSPEVIMVNYLMDLCEAVHFSLSKSGMTQKELAAKLGKKPSQITRILSGEANVTLRTIAELDSALDLGLELRPHRREASSASIETTVSLTTGARQEKWSNDTMGVNVMLNGGAFDWVVFVQYQSANSTTSLKPNDAKTEVAA